MSLETALHENTEALKALAAIMSGAKLATPAPAPKPEKASVVEPPAANDPVVAETAPVAGATLEDASKLVVALANKKGRDTAVKLLATFDGAAKATALKPEHLASFCEAATAALAA